MFLVNTITLPIVKSSCDARANVRIGGYGSATEGVVFYYAESNAISSTLHCTGPSGSRQKMALAWDGEYVPKNKNIINAKLYFYTIKGESKSVSYRYAEFNEGSTIPSYEPADGAKAGGYDGGWGSIDLGVPKGNSVVIGSDLDQKSILIYFPDGGSMSQTVSECWQIYSHRSASNQPYVVITYDDIPPDPPKSLYPADIMLSGRNIIRFAWFHNSKDSLPQTGFTLQYTLDGVTWTTITQETANQYYDLPANTLPTSGTVTWRVKTRDTNYTESEYSASVFTIGIPPQKAPVLVAPIGQYVEANKTTRFEWVFVGGSDIETQSKYDLQYSVNGGIDWITITESTSRPYSDLPANTLPTGNITWRVRTCNEWTEVSPYSDTRSFTVIGSPAMPLITTITNTARPIVTWQSADQHIYELQVLKDNNVLYNSGKKPSTSEKAFKVPMFLDDGQYIARLRVANEYNLFSGVAEKAFIISTVKPQKPEIELFNEQYCIVINSYSEHDTYVYRDGIEIGKLENNRFHDYTCENKKEHIYFIRVVHDDTFNDSVKAIGVCDFTGSTLALASEPNNFLKLKNGWNKEPDEPTRKAVTGSMQYYDGRKYPVAEYGEFSSKNKSLSFFIKTLEEIEKLEKMIESREVFLLRGKRNIYGAILSVDHVNNLFGYEISFSIEQTEGER